MIFLASRPFERQRPDLMTDEEFEALKTHLAKHPDAGDVIPGAGGFRKLRWENSQRQKGKSGGSRTIYLFTPLNDTTHLVAIYDHEEKKDLSRDEIKALKGLAADFKDHAREARDAKKKAPQN